jgi:hypothetical protein
MKLKRIFQVTATGDVWEELLGTGVPGDLKFVGSFGDQASAIAEARREAALSAPSTVIVLAPDGKREVIEVDGQ